MVNIAGKLEKEGCMVAMTSHEDHQMVTIMSHKMEHSTIYNWYRNGHVEMMERKDFDDISMVPQPVEGGRRKRQTLKNSLPTRPKKLAKNMELVLEVW